MKSLRPTLQNIGAHWRQIRAQWIGWKLSHLDVLAPNLPEMLIRKRTLDCREVHMKSVSASQWGGQ